MIRRGRTYRAMREAEARVRMVLALKKRAGDPPWRRTTLILALAAYEPFPRAKRALQVLADQGEVFGAPETLSGETRTVWRLAGKRRTSHDGNQDHA